MILPDQDGRCSDSSLHNIRIADLDVKLMVEMDKAKDKDRELSDDRGDNHGQPDSRHPVPLQQVQFQFHYLFSSGNK